jgi:SPP1 family predicted phage head-tail adaptor
MAGFSIGALRHRLELQAPVETPDLAGGVARQWTKVATIWAAIEPAGSVATLVGDTPADLAACSILIRRRSDVVAGMRLLKGSRIFKIRTVSDPDERGRRLRLGVEENGA